MCDSHLSRMLALVLLIGGGTAMAAEPALDDPTRPSHVRQPSAERAVPAPSWRVESILVSSGRRLAVINGRVVAENDRVGGARVVEILPYEVTIEYRGEMRRVALVPISVKRPTE